MTDKKPENIEKVKKKQGPIRTGAVIPFVVITSLVIGFNILFLDSTIKSALEYVGEQAVGAEVNIDLVDTDFSKLSVVVKRMQLTDASNPDFNKIEIGTLKFQMLWDALLRGKLVISTANIEDILVNTKRTSRGYLVEKAIESDGATQKTQELLKGAKEEFKGNVFGDIAGVLSGEAGATDLNATLESEKKFKEIEKDLVRREKDIDAKLKSLPTKAELKNLEKRLGKIRWNDLGNLLKAVKVLQEADKLKRDIEKAKKSYEVAGKAIDSGLKEIDKSYKDAEKLVAKDIENITKRMKLPKLDPASIAKMIFGNELVSKLETLKEYQNIAKQYMPARTDKDKPKPVKQARGKGRNYRFGTPNSYPLFWLKLASINSKNDQGKVSGKVENITTNQSQIGKLTTGLVTADFPPQGIRNFVSEFEIDHRDKPIMNIDVAVGSVPVVDKALSDSKETKFIIKKANNKVSISAKLTENHVKFRMKNRLSKIKYHTKAKSKQLDLVLADVAKKTKILTLDARGTGKWDNLKFDIKSNLAKAIEKSVKSLVQQKINKAKNKIKNDVEAKLSGTRKRVDSKVAKLKSDYNKQMKQGQAQMDKIKADLKKKKKKEEKKAKKSTKNLFKGFKGIKL
jgi:uncharacterized protein (TIGR03545 family)